MAKKKKVVMNWHTMHHLYLGQLISCPGKGVFAVGLGLHSWTWIIVGLGLSMAGDLYSLDDYLQHKHGWNTPFHRFDGWLKRMEWYRKVTKWLDKTFFKK